MAAILLLTGMTMVPKNEVNAATTSKLTVGQEIRLNAMQAHLSDYYMQFKGTNKQVSVSPGAGDNSAFKVVAGLAGEGISLEAKAVPGWYVTVQSDDKRTLRLEQAQTSEKKVAATFYAIEPLSGKTGSYVSLQSYAEPTKHLRHFIETVYCEVIDPNNTGAKEDATFYVEPVVDEVETGEGWAIENPEYSDGYTPVNGLEAFYYTYMKGGTGVGPSLSKSYYEYKKKRPVAGIYFSSLEQDLLDNAGRSDGAAIRIVGKIKAPVTGKVRFDMVGDNGFNLMIGGETVIYNWGTSYEKPVSGEITLEKDKYYDFRIDYAEDWGGSNLHLRWKYDGLEKSQRVPASAFYFREGVTDKLVVTGNAGTVEGRVYLLPELPKEVDVTYNDGTIGKEKVQWESVDNTILEKVGVATSVLGYVVGTTAEVSVTLDLKAYDQVGWMKGKPPLSTNWYDEIDENSVPLDEYPRPQLVRNDWMNLNGLWEFEPVKDTQKQADYGLVTYNANQDYTREIMVPYAMESALSGVMTHYNYSWYKRDFKVPDSYRANGKRVIMNFEAIDWKSTIYVNGTKVKDHEGGYDAFSVDITDYLVAGTETQQKIEVKVFDDTSDTHSRGKQTSTPSGIFYTACSGIWGTVWMESVAPISVTNINMTTDIQKSQLNLTVNSGSAANVTFDATIKDGNKVVAEVKNLEANAAQSVVIPKEALKLWSPDSPNLYDIEIVLKSNESVVDTVKSYFGMREIKMVANGKKDSDGKEIKEIYLNGEPIFQLGLLDQGYWPESNLTAPTDEALKWDIQAQKDMGYNMIRKHIKVESKRWYYYADKLGMLVWQDQPSTGSATDFSFERYSAEIKNMVKSLGNHPSIVLWVVYNEGWGQHTLAQTSQLTKEIKAMDPTRLTSPASGWNDAEAGDIIDRHDYGLDPGINVSETRARVIGETGGLQYAIPDNMWTQNIWGGYGADQGSGENFLREYSKLIDKFLVLKENKGLQAVVYTEFTDVETELNGIYTYDRKVLKTESLKDLREVNKQLSGVKDPITEPSPDPGTTPAPENTPKPGTTPAPGVNVTDIATAEFIAIPPMTYTGSAVVPSVVVKYNQVVLVEGKDYHVAVMNNINVGTATAIVTGTGTYKGSKSVNYTITPKAVSTLTVKNIVKKKYSGKAIKQNSIKVYDGTKELTSGKDYTLMYSNNVSCGRGKITVTGKGNYTGSKVAYFNILPNKITNVKLKSKTKKQLKIQWKATKGKISGYQITYSTSKLFKNAKSKVVGNKLSYVLKKVSLGKKYYVKVRAYKIINGKKVFGEYSVKKLF